MSKSPLMHNIQRTIKRIQLRRFEFTHVAQNGDSVEEKKGSKSNSGKIKEKIKIHLRCRFNTDNGCLISVTVLFKNNRYWDLPFMNMCNKQ